MRKLVFSLFFILVIGISAFSSPEQLRLRYLNSITNSNQLSEAALFTFAIISDNKGYARGGLAFGHAYHQINDLGAEFVIGMGDNLHGPWKMDFLNLATPGNPTYDIWWHENFWPNPNFALRSLNPEK